MRLTQLLLMGSAGPALIVSALDLRLITYNVRLATGSPGKNELPWSDRRPLLTEQLKSISNADTLMCFQEAFDHVVDDINNDLGDEWSHAGKGRDDGDRKGEFSPVFYRNDAWDLTASNTYWLSKTPDKPSRSWDAKHNRIVTVAELTHKESGEALVYMCTHFEWKGKTAQAHSADIILDLVDGYADVPVFVAGDLNLEPSEKPYEILTSGLTDLRSLVARPYEIPASGENVLGIVAGVVGGDVDVKTYTGFTEKEKDMLIDFIFVRDADSVENLRYTVPSNIKDGEYISDHRPVVVDVEVSGE